MATAIEVIVEAEAMGVRLSLNDGRIKASYSARKEPSVAAIIERLKANRDQVAEALRRRSEIPQMPSGVRLVAWKLKQPPVVLERRSVVIDTRKFALTTLDQLGAALAGENWAAGNWSVRELVDRLEQVGAIVELVDSSE